MEKYLQKIEKSQAVMRECVQSLLPDYQEQLQNHIPEYVENIEVCLYKKTVFDDIDFKISTSRQTAFFEATQGTSSISSFWMFLENIAIGAKESFWFQDQEGPEVGIFTQYLNEQDLRIVIFADGWWKFSKEENGLHKIIKDKVVITFDCICPTKFFITSIYKNLRAVKYDIGDGSLYDPWYNEPKDSEIIKRYLADADNS